VFYVAFEKTPLKSKKFIAFFFSLLVIASVLVAALFTQVFSWAMAMFMCIGILGICAISVGYVLSQAALDKFMRSVVQLEGKMRGELSGNTNRTEE
jgi:hypothetical protein